MFRKNRKWIPYLEPDLVQKFQGRYTSISEVSLVYFYDSCIYAFMFVIGAVVLVTVFVIYAFCNESFSKGIKQLFKKASN